MQAFPRGMPVQVSQGGGALPRWSRTRNELFWFSGPRLSSAVVEAKAGGTLEVAGPTVLFNYPDYLQANNSILSYDVARDGRFLIITSDTSVRADHLVVVRGWNHEVDRARLGRGLRMSEGSSMP